MANYKVSPCSPIEIIARVFIKPIRNDPKHHQYPHASGFYTTLHRRALSTWSWRPLTHLIQDVGFTLVFLSVFLTNLSWLISQPQPWLMQITVYTCQSHRMTLIPPLTQTVNGIRHMTCLSERHENKIIQEREIEAPKHCAHPPLLKSLRKCFKQ